MCNMKRRIVIIPRGGLCNRMQFVNACASLKKPNIIMTCFWEKNDECYIDVKDLFADDSPFYDKMSVITVDYRHPFLAFVYLGMKKICRIFRVMIDQLDFYYAKEEMEKALEEKEADFAKLLLSGWAHCFSGCEKLSQKTEPNCFIPNQSIIDSVNNIVPTSVQKKYVSFHIRRFDVNDGMVIPESYFENIEKKLSKTINSGKTVFLACDDKNYKDKLLDTYGSKNQILYQRDMKYGRSNTDGIVSAYIDLICLSFGSVVYGVSNSSFSRMAANIGGIQMIELGADSRENA